MITTVREVESSLIRQRIVEFVDVYRQVYAEPPYHETDDDATAFGERLIDEAIRPGFAMVMIEDDGQIIGFAHGFTFGPDRWWKAADVTPGEVAGKSKFAVMELIVRRDHRGLGLSSLLIRELLRSRPEPYATLCTNPLAPARAIYAHWGWRHVGNTPERPTFPAMHVLVVPLEDRRP